MRIAAYCRVSTEHGEQLESLEKQKEFFADFAEKYGHSLYRIYADEGISGKQMKNRRAFLEMLADSRRDVFDMVVVKDISRFARNTVDFLNAVRDLKGRNIEVQFLSNNQTILGNSEFILTIFSALAQEESANLSKRVKFGKKVNAKKGRVPQGVYGYDRIDNFHLTINPVEAEGVRRIFSLYCEKGYGVRRIAEEMTREQFRPKRDGESWSPRSIRHILANPLYAGTLVTNKFDTVDFLTGKLRETQTEERFFHERPEYAIISPETYQQAQQIAAKRKLQYGTGNPGGGMRYPLSGRIRCAECGRRFVRRVVKYRNTYVVWGCPQKAERGFSSCENHVKIDEDRFWAFLSDFVYRILPDQTGVRKAFMAQTEESSCDRQTQDEHARAVLLRKKDRLLDLYLQELLSVDAYAAKCGVLDDKLACLNTVPHVTEPKRTESDILPYLDVRKLDRTALMALIEHIDVQASGKVLIRLRRFTDSL